MRKNNDWTCNKCSFVVFGSYRSDTCPKCKTSKYSRKNNDWTCSNCSFVVFESHALNACPKCNTAKPDKSQSQSLGKAVRRQGDWDCPNCGILIFGTKDKCFKCNASKPGAPSDVEIPDSDICRICVDKKKSHIALPCGHYCMCGDCSKLMRNCPVCRAVIVKFQLVFES